MRFVLLSCVALNRGADDVDRVLVRAFAGDEARPLDPLLGECGPLGAKRSGRPKSFRH